jgi:muconolactone delta-isomerase
MRFLVVATPRTSPPPEMIIRLIDRAEDWHRRYEDKFEAFGIFPGGGGFGVVDVVDEGELHRILAEMPFSPFSDHDIRTFVDHAAGWRQLKEAAGGMLAHA